MLAFPLEGEGAGVGRTIFVKVQLDPPAKGWQVYPVATEQLTHPVRFPLSHCSPETRIPSPQIGAQFEPVLCGEQSYLFTTWQLTHPV